MNSELQFLLYISKNPTVSQRHLAKELGMSLGSANTLIKEMTVKGFITAKSGAGGSTSYHLTEQGRFYFEDGYTQHIADCFLAITDCKEIIKYNIRRELVHGYSHFVLVGEEDTIYKLIKMCFIEIKRDYPVEFTRVSQFNQSIPAYNTFYYYWNNDLRDVIPKGTNILRYGTR